MTKQKISTESQTTLTVAMLLKGTSDIELLEAALCSAFRIKTLKQCEKRATNLLGSAKAHGKTWGNGKRCSRHHRCGNLACPICRLRAQYACITKWSDFVRPAKRQAGAK